MAIVLTSFITVAVCTFNRCASLARVLDSLAEQRNVGWAHFEVLVVDNNCTDSTARVVDAFRDCLPIQRIVEPSQGLSFARNRALVEARGDWVLFTDDDVILDENWLANYAMALTQARDFDFAGGRILPSWGGRPPRWFKGERLDLLDGVLVWFDLGHELRALTVGEPLPFGASFAVRHSLNQRIGLFRTDLGVQGQAPGRGEETELMRRAQLAGAKGLYVGNALCWHVVDPKRLKFRALLRYGEASGIAYKAFENPSLAGSRVSAALYLVRGLVQLAKGRGDRFRQCVINAGAQLALASKG